MYSIVMTTFHVPEYLKLCIDSILENSYYKTHQLCIHVNYDKESMDYLDSKNIKYIVTEDIGAPDALNLCIDQARYENTIITNDDCYFTKNWDYYLRQWETELNEKFPEYLKFVGYRWCEPNFGSYPPICDAGKDINEFNVNKVNEYVQKNTVHDLGNWYFNCTYPTKILTKCKFSPEFSPKGNEVDFGLKILNYLKNNNIKFLIFAVKDCYVYHFQRVSSSKHRPKGENVQQSLFESKWGMSMQDAYNLLHDEVKRSTYTIKGIPLPKEDPEREEIKRFVTKGYKDILQRSPDSDGLDHYIQQIYDKIITRDRFLEILRDSDEFKNRKTFLKGTISYHTDLEELLLQKSYEQNKFGDDISWENFAEEILKETDYNKDKIAFKYEEKKDVIDHIEKYIQKGKVLDCGCHIGRWINIFKTRGFDYIGIDQSKNAIQIAMIYFPNSVLYNKFLWEINFNKNFDLAFCNNVLQHNTIDEKNRILPCLYKSLKSNGILFINESTVYKETKTQLTYEGWIKLIVDHGFVFLESWNSNASNLDECYLFKKL